MNTYRVVVTGDGDGWTAEVAELQQAVDVDERALHFAELVDNRPRVPHPTEAFEVGEDERRKR